MADDDQPGAATERWAARNADRFRKFRQWWRPLAFFLIAAITAGIGIYFKSGANPGAESEQFASQAPLAMDFFVTNPQISVEATVDIYPTASSGSGIVSADSEFVALIADAPAHVTGSILVLSNVPAPHAHFYRLIPPKGISGIVYSRQVPFDSYYATELALPKGPLHDAIVGTFERKIIESTPASYYGHLPSVGDIDNYFYFFIPPLLAELNTSRHLVSIVVEPGIKTFITPRRGTVKYFWLPANFKASETFQGIGPLIKSEQLNYMTPNAIIKGDNYSWNGAANLEPIFEITNQSATQNENNDAFLSGIFLAIAGGAVIALLQEVPGNLPRASWKSRWKRKSRMSSTSL